MFWNIIINIIIVSANHILQNFLSAENFPEWKWAFQVFIWRPMEALGQKKKICGFPVSSYKNLGRGSVLTFFLNLFF
jgi:hypothetical protein